MPGFERLPGTVLVTDANRGSALAIMRSFKRKGWRVIAADADRFSSGFYSRHVDERVLYASPPKAAHQFVDTLQEAVRTRDVDLVIPVTDEAILPLVHTRESFEEICQLAVPETPLLEATRNKCRTIKMATRLEVPVPLTFAVHTADEAVLLQRRKWSQKLRWPIVLKPVMSRKYNPESGRIERFSVSYANNVAMLVRQMEMYEGRCPVLLQEYYRGSGQGVELLACNGQPLAAFQHRRLCEVPVYGGPSALRESVALDGQLYEYARRLTEALNWTGLLMVEFKVGDEGAKLMEINGRVWGSLPLAVASGMDFPGRLADLYEKGSPARDSGSCSSFSSRRERTKKTATEYTVGVQAADLEKILKWVAQVLWGRGRYDFLPFPTRREALPVLLKLFSPALRYDMLSLADPRPGIMKMVKIGRKFFRKAAPRKKRRARPFVAAASGKGG